MKVLLSAVSLLIAGSAFATDNACVTKQKNAASYTLAQTLVVPVQKVKVVKFAYGMWTEAVGNNTGSDTVTVSAVVGNVELSETYEVSAKQLGTTANCDVTQVEQVQQ